jgi:glutamate dehydrogenase (NAD(P)+)
VVFCLEGFCEHLGREIAGARVAIQGFGKVGAVVARELSARGARIVAVADVAGGLVNEDGLEIDALTEWVAENRFLRGFDGGDAVTRMEVLEVPCEVLVPAALEHQITADNAADLRCEMILEAANGPTTPEAEAVLDARGIRIVPDLLANAGGVTVSYYEWAQDVQREAWSGQEVIARLRRQMTTAASAVIEAAETLGTDWRTAAHAISVGRVAEASELRAVYP